MKTTNFVNGCDGESDRRHILTNFYRHHSRWSPYDRNQTAFRVGMSESKATAEAAMVLSSSTRTDGKKKIIEAHITVWKLIHNRILALSP